MNDRQLRFVEEYAVDLNATRAAKRAGYSCKTAYSQGARLLKNVEVQAAIQHKARSRVRDFDLTCQTVIDGLADIAVNGKSESARIRAYELLGKHLQMFSDRDAAFRGPEGQSSGIQIVIPHNGRDPLNIESV